jgi:hypothetical protein
VLRAAKEEKVSNWCVENGKKITKGDRNDEEHPKNAAF